MINPDSHCEYHLLFVRMLMSQNITVVPNKFIAVQFKKLRLASPPQKIDFALNRDASLHA